jgi:tetratricopeptide (TPR) repeat protein
MPTSHTPTLWNIPYQRNPFFTGREDVLSQLHQTLSIDTTVALSHPQGISGLGGIGKTQTALEYAYRHQTEYNAVLWVRADSVASLTSSLVELARVLGLPERHEQDQEIIVQAVLRWFRLHTDWLLIYDNIDDLSMAEPFLPKAGSGHLLLTTRAHALGGLAERLDIQKMEPEIGAWLLLRRANIIAIKAVLNMATSEDQSVARAISQELDGLPLALDQAGAYIKETPCLLSDYVSLYRTRRGDILPKRGSFDQDYPASVATTWSLSFEKVSQANPASAELLDFCAFLAPDPIPETLITQGAQHLPPILQKAVVHPPQFDRVISTLLAYSLLHRESSNDTVSVHRLVQAILKDQMDEPSRHQWAQRDVRAVNAAFPEVEFETWPQCERLLPHALLCATWIEQEQMTFPEASRLLNQTGDYLKERARYAEAEPLYQRALSIREQQLGALHPNTAFSLNNLALLYDDQGKDEQAEPLVVRALAIYEQQLGPEHPHTASILIHLGYIYRHQGKYEQAEPLLKRALAIDTKAYGTEHPNTALSLNNLALLYQDQGKYSQAEPLYQRALSIREQQLGPEHPSTALSLNNLALLYHHQGKYEQAEPLYERALSIYEQQVGPLHPNTAGSLNNLANLYQDQGKYEQAEPLYQRALAISEQQLGPEHPNTANSLNNLAGLYRAQGKYEQAEPLLKRAFSIDEKTLGPEHPDLATDLNNLAALYFGQGKYAQAEPLFKRALAIYERILGPQHPTTQRIQANSARLLRTMGRDAEATALDQP